MVTRIVQQIDVIAGAADQPVGSRTAIQGIGAAVASNDVVEVVASAVGIARASEREVLDIGRQHPVDVALYGVDSAVGSLHNRVTGACKVSIVPVATDQCVGATAAAEEVVARIPSDGVCQ